MLLGNSHINMKKKIINIYVRGAKRVVIDEVKAV